MSTSQTMSCHGSSGSTTLNTPIILAGNPNVGKSVIFGRLTGRYVTVSNYPGTTIELTYGELPNGGQIIDTPGINSLGGNSDDERVTREVLFAQRDNVRAVVQVADAKNLKRALTLTLQLIELGVPLVLALNMIDEAEANGLHVDVEQLAERLGIAVIPTVATRGTGLAQLLEAVNRARPAYFVPEYDAVLEDAIIRVKAELPRGDPYPNAIALRLLSGDAALTQELRLNGQLTDIQEKTAAYYQRPLNVTIAQQRSDIVQRLLAGIVIAPPTAVKLWRDRLAGWATDPIWGWPILLLVLFVVYKFVGELGAGTLVKFLESTVFGQWLNPLATQLVDAVLPIPLIHDLLVGQYGLLTMALTYGLAIVLPIVTTFFIAFSILEDSGYLPRLAVMLNRVFKLLGLNGKAVLPMVLGLGCDTMATMTTRILETRKERILVTLLLALGVPCSAQLGVLLGMSSIMSATALAIWALVVVGTMMSVGFLAARFLPGERSDFILELPPIRWPQPGHIVIKTLARLEWYLKEVLPLFIVGTFLLFVLDKTGLLVTIEQVMAPLVVNALGLPAQAADAFLIGFLRRDYGAAGLFTMALAGKLTSNQLLVSLIVITLFIPCVANVLMIVKEYGVRVAVRVAAVVFPLAFIVGALVNVLLNAFHITL